MHITTGATDHKSSAKDDAVTPPAKIAATAFSRYRIMRCDGKVTVLDEKTTSLRETGDAAQG